jgi:hypothetical protein
MKALHAAGTSIDDARIAVLARAHAAATWQEHTHKLSFEQSQAIVGSLSRRRWKQAAGGYGASLLPAMPCSMPSRSRPGIVNSFHFSRVRSLAMITQ